MKKCKTLSFVMACIISLTSLSFTCSAAESIENETRNTSNSSSISTQSIPAGQGVYMSGLVYQFADDSRYVGIQQFEGNRLTVSANVVSVHSGSVSKVYVRIYQQNSLGNYFPVATGSFSGTSGTHTVISGAKISANARIKFVAWVEGSSQPTATIGIGAVASNY